MQHATISSRWPPTVRETALRGLLFAGLAGAWTHRYLEFACGWWGRAQLGATDRWLLFVAVSSLALTVWLQPVVTRGALLLTCAVLGAACFAAAGLDHGWHATTGSPRYAALALELSSVLLGLLGAGVFATSAFISYQCLERVRTRRSRDAPELLGLSLSLTVLSSYWFADVVSATGFSNRAAFDAPALVLTRRFVAFLEVVAYATLVVSAVSQLRKVVWLRRVIAGKVPGYRVEHAQPFDAQAGLPVIVSSWRANYPRVLVSSLPGQPEQRLGRVR